MRGFRFRFNKILEVKEVELKQRQRDLSAAIRARVDALARQTGKEREIESFSAKLMRLELEKAGDLSIQYRYYHDLVRDLRSLQELVALLEKKENIARENLISVQKEQKILQKLREKEYEEFVQSALKETQSAIDELAVLGAHKSMKI